eukprot:4058085-Amphidinium_carterae.3
MDIEASSSALAIHRGPNMFMMQALEPLALPSTLSHNCMRGLGGHISKQPPQCCQESSLGVKRPWKGKIRLLLWVEKRSSRIAKLVHRFAVLNRLESPSE